MSMINFMDSRVEHEKSFITSSLGPTDWLYMLAATCRPQNSLDQDQSVGPDLDPNCLTL